MGARGVGVLLLILAVTLTACGLGAPAGPKMRVEDAWSRVAKAMGHGQGEAMGSVGAAFMTLVNEGREGDRLIAVQADIATTVEIHQTIIENEVMRMEPVSGIDVPAGERVELKPGGYHVMLIGLKRDLEPGTQIPLTLTFEKSGTLTVEAKVRQP